MYEDRPEKDTPFAIREMLRDYGGLAPNGLPIWRLVLAQNCRIQCFGQMNHLPVGLKLSECEDGDMQPERIEEGSFWVPRHKSKGWILQRWFPASVWGARSQWESEKSRDGRTRMLAAYPAAGDYKMMCGPWTTIDAAGDLKASIREYNRSRQLLPVNWENYERAMCALEEHERQERIDEYALELEAAQASGIAPLLRSVSASAQDYRNRVSEETAGGVNLGASEKWG